jgi:hypothetical protein
MKQRQFGRDSYEYILENQQTMTLAELAKDLSMRESALAHALMLYCMTHKLDVPRLMLERKSNDAKVLKRHDTEQQIRISTIRLKQANLEEVMRFKSFVDPERRFVLITAEDGVQANTLEEVLEEVFGVVADTKKTRKTQKSLTGSEGQKKDGAQPESDAAESSLPLN